MIEYKVVKKELYSRLRVQALVLWFVVSVPSENPISRVTESYEKKRIEEASDRGKRKGRELPNFVIR
jgi:hypothetical protein